MNIYIDIDGVLLTKDKKIPEYAEYFIEYLTKNYSCYWLTTHCREGKNKALSYLSEFYSDSCIKTLKTIKPTNWSTLKTEAIDFSSDFIWLDDYPFEAEIRFLENKNKLSSLIIVDLKRIHELKNIVKQIQLYKTHNK